eukprot:685037-Pyramimonas_sp.AAC.1
MPAGQRPGPHRRFLAGEEGHLEVVGEKGVQLRVRDAVDALAPWHGEVLEADHAQPVLRAHGPRGRALLQR